MYELLKKYNFLCFNNKEIDDMSKDDLEMAFISNYIKNNYSCKEFKVYYATTLYMCDDITTDLYLIEIYGVIVRYIEIVDDRRLYCNTDNILLANQRIENILGGILK